MEWKRKKGKYSVYCGSTWEKKKGSYYILFPFIIHRYLSNPKMWSLSHLPTGMSIGKFRLLKHTKGCGILLKDFDCFLFPTADGVVRAYTQNETGTKIRYILSQWQSL
jgi:hypothetical protein